MFAQARDLSSIIGGLMHERWNQFAGLYQSLTVASTCLQVTWKLCVNW